MASSSPSAGCSGMFDLGWLLSKDLAVFVCGGAFTASGWLLKRWWQGDGAKEKLESRSKAVELHQKMQSLGLDVEGVDKIHATLSARRRLVRKNEDLLAEVFKSDSASVFGDNPALSQRGMNAIAGASLKVAQAELERTLVEFSLNHVADNQELEASQNAWVAFSEAQASLLAAPSKGGSIYPLEYCSELEELTRSRIADLRAQMGYFPR